MNVINTGINIKEITAPQHNIRATKEAQTLPNVYTKFHRVKKATSLLG